MAITPPSTNEDTQVNPAVGFRNIYSASYGEIMAKSFVAGLFLGMGKTLASLVFWVIILVLSVQLLQPLVDPLLKQLEQLQQFTTIQQGQPNFGAQPNIDSLIQQFQNRPGTQTQ